MNRQEFFSGLFQWDPWELRSRVKQASADECRWFCEYYGVERFERIKHSIQSTQAESGESTKPNVVLIPGIMGSEIEAGPLGQATSLLWFELNRLVFEGEYSRLRLAKDGTGPFEQGLVTTAPRIIGWYFDEMEQFLLPDFQVHRFPYDWRMDLRTIADQLDHFLETHFGDAPVHLIAHSMGCLVSRLVIAKRLKRGVSPETVLGPGGRLLMLGPPNLGSYEAFKILTGMESSIQLLALGLQSADLFLTDYETHVGRCRQLVHSFPAVYQLLPTPDKLPQEHGINFYSASGYDGVGSSLSATHFQSALECHALLAKGVIPSSMRIVAGCDTFGSTAVGISGESRVTPDTVFKSSSAGDGTVAHELSKLPDVPMYYVNGSHGELMSHSGILGETKRLLMGGPDDVQLSKTPIAELESATPAIPPTSNISSASPQREVALERFVAIRKGIWNRPPNVSPSADELAATRFLLADRLGATIDMT